MICEILYEDALMRNPFDENDTATKQELANYVFYGRKNKFDTIRFSYQQIRPHLLKNHIENTLNSADALKRQCGDLHSLLDVLYRKFMVVQREAFGYDYISFSLRSLDNDLQSFLTRLFNKEVSLYEMIRTFKKNNRAVNCLLHNKLLSKGLLRKIITNEPLSYFIEHNDKDKEFYFLCCAYFIKDEKTRPEANLLFDDLRRLLHMELVLSQKCTVLSSVPTELHDIIRDFFKLFYYLISGDKDYIPALDYIKTEDTIYAAMEPLPDNQIKITNKSILFENINFNNDEAMSVIRSTVQYNQMDFEFIGFNLCNFDKSFILDSDTDIKHNIFFKDCTFNKTFQVKNYFITSFAENPLFNGG